MACPFVTGALCRANGTWGVLKPKKLRAIHAMRKIDEATEAKRRARRKRARLLSEGDAAMFRSGPFAAFCCEVVELPAQGGAKVRFQLFGREVLTDADCADLVPMRKRG